MAHFAVVGAMVGFNTGSADPARPARLLSHIEATNPFAGGIVRQLHHRRSRLRKNAQFLAREMHVVEMIAVAMHVDGASSYPDSVMPILSIKHVTTYHYKRAVAFGEHRMMLRPRDDDDQKVIESELEITPSPKQLDWTRDSFRQSRSDRSISLTGPASFALPPVSVSNTRRATFARPI